MALHPTGMTRDEVLNSLDGFKANDVAWKQGRAFSLVYPTGPDVAEVADQAFRRFSSENALNTDAFPSLRRIQAEVVDIVSEWVHGGPGAAGFMTSGGTESILMAVKGARERGRRERNISQPNVVLPTTAHAAFEKACYYFGLESRRVAVGSDWRADPAAMAAAIDDNTVLVVGSAPQYPQGVVDPIPELAALAAARDINCHVDGCMGGVTLTYMAKLGYPVPPWNFDVPGVTSISVDLHKYAYTAKGASVIVYRDKKLRSYQTYVTDNWLGGFYGSSGILGTKGGGAMAAAWAVLNYLGDQGYMRVTAAARTAAEELAAGIRERPGLVLRSEPDTTLVAFGVAADLGVDAFALADEVRKLGWYIDRQGPPDSLHCTVSAVHQGLIPDFLADLDLAIAAAGQARSAGDAGMYGTVE